MTEAQQIKDLWVPLAIVRRANTNYLPGWTTLEVVRVNKFEMGTVDPTKLEVVFPPGTIVLDQIGKTAYKILDNGQHNPMPWYDAVTGRSHPATAPTPSNETP